ncbi:MAG: 50S ribosome-binding GTPase [Sedimentisphaerales bacterium]|nr:50S ribosome-binding GTPase [Sedimentisphaerales bacterium]
MSGETIAAVLSGKGTGAIAAIGVWGDTAEKTIRKIFRPKGEKSARYEKGFSVLGTIRNKEEIIDEVIIACEDTEYFCINCHGNQLIETDILRLLQRQGTNIVSAGQFLLKTSLDKQLNTIEIEAKLAIAQAKTLEGTKIIRNQTNTGLNRIVQNWQKNIPPEDIKAEAKKILELSKSAGYLIYGAKVVLAGPTNSGKSTLLNCLAGKQKAIVTDVAGTTRDWVSAECKLGKLHCEIIDTAGIDETLFSKSCNADKEAQKKAKELLKSADLIIWVIDAAKKAPDPFFSLKGKPTITVLNKSDLLADAGTAASVDTIAISAKFGNGVEKLIKKIHLKLGIDSVNTKEAVCFTDRQRGLLEQIISADSKESILSTISELLNGKVCV